MLALDHLVVAAKDPLKSAKQFAEKYDVKVVQGGKHDMWGTHNALAYFQNNYYIEWLGIFDLDLAKRSDNPLIQQLVTQLENVGDGLFQYGLRTTDMDSYVKYFTKNDLPFVGPLAGERQRPDGTMLSWRMLFPKSSLLVTPFLIEWGQASLYGADPEIVNDKALTVYLNEKENLNLFHRIYRTKEQHKKVLLQNGEILLAPKNLLRVKINH